MALDLEHPAISNCFSLPLAQINPGHLELYYVPKKRPTKFYYRYLRDNLLSGSDLTNLIDGSDALYQL